MRVAEAVGQALVDVGVRHAFGVVGSGNFAVTEAMRAAGATFVAARQETAAACMADGYAAVTGLPGIVTVHQGPGYANALTGMIEAAKSRSPVLLLAADTPESWTHSNFRMDQAAAARAGGIEVVRLGDAASAADDLQAAWSLVAADRRATALLMPLDVQQADVPTALALETAAREPVTPDAATIAAAAELLSKAERPVIIAGRGAARAGAREAIEQLAAAIGAPVATSAVAHGLFAGNPWNLGISGGFATPLAIEVIGAADVVLSFGASLNRWTTRHGRMIDPDAVVIAVDDEADAIGRHRPVTLGVIGDARLAAEALHETLAPSGREHGPGLAERIERERWSDIPFADASEAATVDPRTVTIALDRILPSERIVVVDGGHFSGWAAMYLSVPPDGFIFHQAFQSIGLGLGTAIGAAVGRPDRTVVAAVGDGGAFMALGELETMARLRLPMVVLVYNDDAYGAEVHHFGPDDVPLDTVRFSPTDVAAVARALGADGITVRDTGDLDGIGRWLDERPHRPLVVDLKVTPTVVGEWLPEAFRA